MNRETKSAPELANTTAKSTVSRSEEPSAADIMRSHEFTFFAGALFLVLAYLLYFTPELPQRLATHFNGAGRANGWSSRESFVWLYGGLLASMAITFGGLAVTVGKIPASLWSFPNRDWWLTGARSTATRRYLACWLLRYGTAISLFLGVTLYQIVQANLASSAHLSNTYWITFTLFILYTMMETGRLIWRFRSVRPGSTP